MDPLRDEIEQAQIVKQWIRNYAPSIIGGVALGLAVLYGWNAWQGYRHTQAVNAAGFFTALEALADTDMASAIRQGEGLIADFPNTPYATNAALLLARLYVEQDNLQGAEEQLRWAVENAKPAEVAHVARMRLARVMEALGRSDEALALLESADPEGYAGSYAELRGDILSKTGDMDAARTAYREALDELGSSGADPALLQMKLDNLATQEEVYDDMDATE